MKKFCRFYELKKVGSNALGGVFYSVTRDEEKKLRDYMLVEVREEYHKPKLWTALTEFFRFSRKLSHPNILPYDVWGKCRDGYYAATRCREFFSLSSVLAQLKKRDLPFSFDIPIQAIFQLSTGLQYLANTSYKGSPIYHNLITPEDIMISLDGVVYIANFGIYQTVYSQDRSLAGELAVERSAFLAPEILDRKKPGPQADIYSVGVLLFYLLTGKLLSPQRDLDAQLKEARMIARWEGGEEIPGALREILKKALAPAEARFKTMAEFTEALEAFVAEEDITPTTFNLAYYMNTLFQEEKEERERLIRESRGKVPVEIIEEPEEKKPLVEGVVEEKKKFPAILAGALAALLLLVIAGLFLLKKPAPRGLSPEEMERRINQLVEQKMKEREALIRKEYEEKYGKLTAQKEEELKKALEKERQRVLAQMRRQQFAQAEAQKQEEVQTQVESETPPIQPEKSQEQTPETPTVAEQVKSQGEVSLPEKQEAEKTEEKEVSGETQAKPPEEVKPSAPSSQESSREIKPAVTPGSVVPINELDVPLRLIKRVSPRMPVKALRLRVRGSVMASILIDENGNVAQVRIIRATPKGFFEEEAYRTLLKWKFSPPRKRGVPVKVWKVVTIQFK